MNGDTSELFGQLRDLMGDVRAGLVSIDPGLVLAELTVALDANGTAQGDYRVPFAALAVCSFSAAQLTLASSPLQEAAPGLGPGVAIIPAGGFRVVNLAGTAWSLYGGTPGDLVTVEVFTRPQAANATKHS